MLRSIFFSLAIAGAVTTHAIAQASYPFKDGFPSAGATAKGYDDADYERAVTAYRFWYPAVSVEGIFNGNRSVGIDDNKAMGAAAAGPRQIGFTLNSDTPYGSATLDLSAGPMVIELPPGPYIGLVNDHYQGWVLDMGIPGPDAGKGGKHLVLPPGYKREGPAGYFVGRSLSNKVLVAARALPVNGDVPGAMSALRAIKIYPLAAATNPPPFTVRDTTALAIDSTSLKWEDNIQFWQKLHEIIEAEPLVEQFLPMYGLLSALGIEKGKPFAPDARMTAILERAAKAGRDQLLISAFASDRPDRFAWPDRKWEWVGLVPGSAQFETPAGLDLEARDRWFAQAIVTSPAMFRRTEGAGSLYWLGARDATGAFLEGAKTYKLSIPQPVPDKLFWSVTAYDAQTRSEVQTDQDKAALRSMFELKDVSKTEPTDLYFGPTAPAGKEDRWIKTVPGRGWFAYIRIYGPERAAFDGSWKPDDFVEVGATGKLGVDDDPVSEAIERRAIEAMIWGMPAVNADLMLQEMLTKTTAKPNDILFWSAPADWKNQTLTPNPDSIYFMSFWDVTDGPIVIEVPPAEGGSLAGNIVDAWQMPLEDAGPAGADAGAGGKFLILPPDFKGARPEGYFVLPSQTYTGFALMRSNLASHSDADVAKSVTYGKRIKVYALSQAANPPPTKFADASGTLFDATIKYDASFFQNLDRVVQREPWLDRDRVMIDPLRALGIEKGKAYSPVATATLDGAAEKAHAWLSAQYDAGFPVMNEGIRWFPAARADVVRAVAGGYADPNEYPVEARGVTYTLGFTGIKRIGTAQFYLMTSKDKAGQPFDGGSTYLLRVPPEAPVKNYWSVTVYDRETHALVKNLDKASVASITSGVQSNADGSVDVFFGPRAPTGKEANWVPTDPTRKFELLFRFYSPEKPLFDHSWKLPDAERIGN